MKTNEGTLDRVLRVGAGLAADRPGRHRDRRAWGYIGVVPLLTGAIGVCPLYSRCWASTPAR